MFSVGLKAQLETNYDHAYWIVNWKKTIIFSLKVYIKYMWALFYACLFNTICFNAFLMTYYFTPTNYWFNTLWLAALYYAKPYLFHNLFWEHHVLFKAFRFTHALSGTQLEHKTKPWCITKFLHQNFHWVDDPAFNVSLFAGKYYYRTAVFISCRSKWMVVVCSAIAKIGISQVYLSCYSPSNKLSKLATSSSAQ